MKVDFKGLKFKNWMYLMLFSIVILVVLWFLQFAFLDTFYESMKMNELISIGEQVTSEYKDNDFNGIMNEYAFKNNLRIVLLDEEGNIVNNYDGFGSKGVNAEVKRITGFPQNEFFTMIEKFNETENEQIHYINSNDRAEMVQGVYVQKIIIDNEVSYIYISSPIPRLDSTISVLQTQFVIITIIILVLSIVMAQLISRKMSKPIIELTKSAKNIAKGDFDTEFTSKEFTEINQLADTLSYATKELSKLDNYRKEFIANVSHDLKTPLTIIKFYGEMIKDISGEDPIKRNEHCDTIIKEADWLSDMVNEILELSKLESNNVELIKTKVDLTKCLKDTLSSFNVLAERDGYVFELVVDENVVVEGSPQYLKRALYNLISNAINYTGDNKVVKLLLKNRDGIVRFEVTDSGVGIPEEKLETIFERYYKSDEVHRRAVIGTGLGLSIVKLALELHEAKYGVTSEENIGSTFWFELKSK